MDGGPFAFHGWNSHVNLSLPSSSLPAATEPNVFPAHDALPSPATVAVRGVPFAAMLAVAETPAPADPATATVSPPAFSRLATGTQAMAAGHPSAPWETSGAKTGANGLLETDEAPTGSNATSETPATAGTPAPAAPATATAPAPAFSTLDVQTQAMPLAYPTAPWIDRGPKGSATSLPEFGEEPKEPEAAAEMPATPGTAAPAAPATATVPGPPASTLIAHSQAMPLANPAAPATAAVRGTAFSPRSTGTQSTPSSSPAAPWVTRRPKSGATRTPAKNDEPVRSTNTASGQAAPVAALMSIAVGGGGLPPVLPTTLPVGQITVDSAAVAHDQSAAPPAPAPSTVKGRLVESTDSGAKSADPASPTSPALRLPATSADGDDAGADVSSKSGPTPVSTQVSPLPQPTGIQAPPSADRIAPAPSDGMPAPARNAVNTDSAATFPDYPPVMPKSASVEGGAALPAASVDSIGASLTTALPRRQTPEPTAPLARADMPTAQSAGSTKDSASMPNAPRVVDVISSTAAAPAATISQGLGSKPEKIAVRTTAPKPTSPADTEAASDATPIDTLLDTNDHQLNYNSPYVGIGSAQSSAAMRKPVESSASVRLGSTPGADASGTAAVGQVPAGPAASFGVERHVSQTAPAAEPTLPHAAAAVEAALDAVERVRDTGHSSIELKLSFGDDTRLLVRVELRDGTVQTTFRTDSAELRQALASEWHQAAPSVVAVASDRPAVRVAEPVFSAITGSPDFAGTSTGGHPNSRQAPLPTAEASSRASSSPGPRPTSSADPVPAAPPRHPTSLLNAFA